MGRGYFYNLAIGHLNPSHWPPISLYGEDSHYPSSSYGRIPTVSLDRAALTKAKRNLSRGAQDTKNIHACAFVPLSFRNRSGSTFRGYRPCDFRWTGNLNSRPFVQSSTCTLSARGCMLGGRMMARLTYLRIDRRDLLFASFRRTFYSPRCSACTVRNRRGGHSIVSVVNR